MAAVAESYDPGNRRLCIRGVSCCLEFSKLPTASPVRSVNLSGIDSFLGCPGAPLIENACCDAKWCEDIVSQGHTLIIELEEYN